MCCACSWCGARGTVSRRQVRCPSPCGRVRWTRSGHLWFTNDGVWELHEEDSARSACHHIPGCIDLHGASIAYRVHGATSHHDCGDVPRCTALRGALTRACTITTVRFSVYTRDQRSACIHQGGHGDARAEHGLHGASSCRRCPFRRHQHPLQRSTPRRLHRISRCELRLRNADQEERNPLNLSHSASTLKVVLGVWEKAVTSRLVAQRLWP